MVHVNTGIDDLSVTGLAMAPGNSSVLYAMRRIRGRLTNEASGAKAWSFRKFRVRVLGLPPLQAESQLISTATIEERSSCRRNQRSPSLESPRDGGQRVAA